MEENAATTNTLQHTQPPSRQRPRKDFARIFVGLEPPKGLVRELSRVRDRYGKLPYLRWLLPSDWHITVLFIGVVHRSVLPSLQEGLAEVAQAHASISLTLANIMYAPPFKPSSMVWARFEQSEALDALARDVLQKIRAVGLTLPHTHAGEVTIPHITLARFRKDVRVSRTHLRTIRAERLREWEVEFNRLVLYETVGVGDRGKRYTKVAQFRLQEEGEVFPASGA